MHCGCRLTSTTALTVVDVKSFNRPTPSMLRKALKRTSSRMGWAIRAAYRTSALMDLLEDAAIRKARTLKAIARKTQRQARRWTEGHPYMLLAVFPLWGNPRSFPVTPRTRLWKRFLGGLALISVATGPWAVAYGQLQSMFADMNEAKAVAKTGQIAFDQLKTMLELSSALIPVFGCALIGLIAAMAMLMHRLEIVVTQWDLRARPRVGYRFHVVQVSSLALYLGLLTQWLTWSMNHRSFAEPLFHWAINSPLILLPACLWLLVHRHLDKNRKAVRRKLYGDPKRALIASLLSTGLCVGVLALLMRSLK